MSKHIPGAERLAERILTLIEEDSFLKAGISGGSGIGFERPAAVEAVATLIDQETAAERDRLRAALEDCERVMNISANQLCTSVSSTELSALNRQLVECVIRTRTALAEPGGEKEE